MMVPSEGRRCRLAAYAERVSDCVESCPFWEPGGAVLEGRCALESVAFSSRPELAAELLDVRDRVLEASDATHVDETLHALHRLLNEHGDE